MPIPFGLSVRASLTGLLEGKTQSKKFLTPGKSLPSVSCDTRSRDALIPKMGKRDNDSSTPDLKFKVEDGKSRWQGAADNLDAALAEAWERGEVRSER